MIQIHLVKISSDSLYIDFIVECPTNYIFNHLRVKKYDYDPIDENDDGWRDISSAFIDENTTQTIRIATSLFNDSDFIIPTMYYLEFGVSWNGEGDEPSTPCSSLLSASYTQAACSNLNEVYANLLDLILKLQCDCVSSEDYETLTRNYMIMYAHSEAMRLQRFNEAETFYDIIKNLFINCSPTTRQIGIVNNCNCK